MRISQKISKVRGSTVRIKYKPVLKPAPYRQGAEKSVAWMLFGVVCAASKGTHVVVKIFAGSDFFEANGSVVFSQPDMGLSLAFRDVKPYFLAVLQKWLKQAIQENKPNQEK
jgi:hypothetical protein